MELAGGSEHELIPTTDLVNVDPGGGTILKYISIFRVCATDEQVGFFFFFRIYTILYPFDTCYFVVKKKFQKNIFVRRYAMIIVVTEYFL